MNPEKLNVIKLLSIDFDSNLIDGLRLMDRLDRKLLIVLKNDSYKGLLSAGDVARAIIANVSLESPIEEAMRQNIRVASVHDDMAAVRDLMMSFRTEFMPVLDDDGNLADVVLWAELFDEEKPEFGKIDLPVVVMAGGKGTRLKPFSNILPKALFPLGEGTILEAILERFRAAGCCKFFLSVNHKADFIRSYMEQLEGVRYDFEYVQEITPLGTGGSLSLLKDRISEPFFVSNCDILIDTDLGEVVDYHREQANEITLVAALKHTRIPYGTLKTTEGGQLEQFDEKPEFTHLVNSGMYVLEPHLLAEIPEKSVFHITELIEQVLARGGRVGVFPVSEKSWCDIGEWHEYRRTMEQLGVLA